MSQYIFPETITSEYLDELAQKLTARHVRYLSNEKVLDGLESRGKKIEAQIPDIVDLLSQYTENQYVEQEVEIMPGLKAMFRTLTPQNMDQAIKFAEEHSTSPDTYNRIMPRMRLAYGIVSINGNRVGDAHFQGSYFSAMDSFSSIDEFYKEMDESANKRYNYLSVHGLSDKVSEAFGLWEGAVWDKINYEDPVEAIKKSTGGSEGGQ